jgi:hypothetical protein
MAKTFSTYYVKITVYDLPPAKTNDSEFTSYENEPKQMNERNKLFLLRKIKLRMIL